MRRCFIVAIWSLVGIVAGAPRVAPARNPLPIPAAEKATGPLAEYVAKPDATYRWEKRCDGELAGGRFVELTLTSQTWREITWKHQLFILRPKEIGDSGQALLLIDGGSWNADLEKPIEGSSAKLPSEAQALAVVAASLKTPVVVIKQVPHQPIFDGKREDEIIAYTFARFLQTQDAEWPLLLPMVKSAVRAMDASQEFCRQQWNVPIDSFTVTGASKRGWTTWLTSAVDPRVKALAPMVIDTLNMGPQMAHQLATWGKFSEQIEDYTRLGLQQHMASRSGVRLNAIVDPYQYRRSITQPKLILLGTNDRYWPLDALNLYYDELQGEKRILYVPNNGHGLKDLGRVLGTIMALHRASTGEIELPKLDWQHEELADQVQLQVSSSHAPARVEGWVATAPTKDFRDATWTSESAELVGGQYRIRKAAPQSGYMALFGEATFENGSAPYFFSTTIKIVSAKQ